MHDPPPIDSKRVLIVSHYYDPEPLPKAGELAHTLRDRGHDVRVVTGLPTYPAGRLHEGYRLALRHREVRDGIAVTRTFEVPYHGRSAARRLVNYGSTIASLPLGWTRGWAPDAVYVWSPPPTSIAPAHVLARAGRRAISAAASGGRRRPPIVMDIQDLWPDFGLFAGMLHEGPKVEVLRAIERLSYRAADRLIVPTEGYRRAVLAKGVPEHKVEVIPNWIPDEDAEVPSSEAVAAARRRERWDGRFVVLFAGNLGNVQGLDAVLDAAAAHDEPDVVWAFAGDGTDRDRLMEQASARGLLDRVQFLGRRNPATMPALAGAADVLLVHLRPSPLARMVVPTKINGYLAYGRPILCALEGEGAQLVERADAGVVVTPGDGAAICGGLRSLRSRSDAQRRAMGDRGRAFARSELTQSSLLRRYETAMGLTDMPRPAAPQRRTTVATHPLGNGATPGRMLVTGATGSLGPAVVDTARAAGVPVRVLARRPGRFSDDVEVHQGDINDEAVVHEAVRGCDSVVHLAGFVHQRGPGADIAHRKINDDAARTVFAAAQEARCRRVVFASSIAVYGRDGLFDEDSLLQPVNAYGQAKAGAEADLRARTNAEGEPLGTILRLATCYGPGAAGNVTALLDALDRRRFVLVGSGTNRKSLLHIDDAAAAIMLVAFTPNAAGRTYDVSDGQPRPLREVIDLMCATLGRRPPWSSIPEAPARLALRVGGRAAGLVNLRVPLDPAMIDILVADVAVPARRIRTDLGFEASFDLGAGLAATVAAGRAPAAPGGNVHRPTLPEPTVDDLVATRTGRSGP